MMIILILVLVRIPVTGATPPDAVSLNLPFRIQLDYLRPSTCHFIEGIDLISADSENNIFTFTLVASLVDRDDCADLSDDARQIPFEFVATAGGVYTFRFFQGTVDGEDQFLEVEIPIAVGG